MRDQITLAVERCVQEVLGIISTGLGLGFASTPTTGERPQAQRRAYAENYGVRSTNGAVKSKKATAKSKLAAEAKANGKVKGNGKELRVRRTQEQIEATAAEVLTYLKAHPGARMEDITGALRVPTAELTRPIKLLLSKRKITRKGTTRAMTYQPSKKEAAAAPVVE